MLFNKTPPDNKGNEETHSRFPGSVRKEEEEEEKAARDAEERFCTQRRFLSLNKKSFHRVAYTEWKNPEPEAKIVGTVVCVHGLTRNGRDFDPLAANLAEAGWRVACPDVVGRGKSDWLEEADDYGYPQYQADMAGLLARLDVAAVDWVGTSMGGLLGLFLAARAQTPIRRLVLNDVGPRVPRAALERIGNYIGNEQSFATQEELETEIRHRYAGFGLLTDVQWRHLARHSVWSRPDGRLGLAYDPAIATAFNRLPVTEDIMLWPVWDALRCPVLVIRGENSDLLLPETVSEMQRRHPKTEFHLVRGADHAPALMDAETIAVIKTFWSRPV